MDDAAIQGLDRIYRLGENAEWGFFLTHLGFNEGFGLFVLLAPEAAGVEVCHRALRQHYAAQKRTLHRIDLRLGDHPATLGDTLLRFQPAHGTAAVWISGPDPAEVLHPEPVRDLWHHALAALNSRRNPLRDRLPVPLIFAGPLWLQEVFRVAAPDFWSVRDSVTFIEPRQLPRQGTMEMGHGSGFSSIDTGDVHGDPAETRRAIAKARGSQAPATLLAGLLTRLGAQLTARHEWSAAEAALLEAWFLIEYHQQSWDEPVRVLHQLCALYFANGDISLVEHYASKMFELTNAQFGQEDGRTLASREWLALAFRAQGKNAEAEQEHRAVLAIRQRVLGAEDPDTLTSRMNLAIALNAQRRNAEAEQEHRAVIAVRDRVLGSEHPDILSSRNNLAAVLQDQGRHAEAEKEFRAVLALQTRVLGAEHPDTLTSRNNLAAALQAQGKYAEAEQEHRAVLARRERVLGAEHLDVIRSCFNLALCLEAQGRLKEALAFVQRAENGLAKPVGSEHQDTKDAKRDRDLIEAALAKEKADENQNK